MSEPLPSSSSSSSVEFAAQVKQVLEHLYDFGYLQKHPLAEQLSLNRKRSSELPAHHLRREVIKAVEMLSPGPTVSSQTPDSRLYRLLQLHYIEGLTVSNVGERLGLSPRQVHRSLRQAESNVADILWSSLTRFEEERAADPNTAQELSSLSHEVAQMETTTALVDIADLVKNSLGALAPVAQNHGVEFILDAPSTPLLINTDGAIAQQLLLSMLGRIINQVEPDDRISISIPAAKGKNNLIIRYRSTAVDPQMVVDEVVRQLLPVLKWTIDIKAADPSEWVQLHVAFHPTTPLVLVIDDNEGLVDLLDRFLSSHQYRVESTTSGKEGLELVQNLVPDAVILDIMMPQVNGWEILQSLRARPETAEVPIIICSVFNDYELAYSLGASKLLSKPVSRDQILDALRELNL